MYTINNLRLSAGSKEILKGVNLNILPGAFTAIVGPNGAGKSTLLKAIANELQHYQGEVSINGKNIKQYSAKELSKVRAVLPQHSTMQFAFSTEQVVLLGRHASTHTKKENQKIVDEVLERTALLSLKDRNYLTLSGGEKQRVQLARVLAQVWEETRYPRFILLDEPTSSMDIAQQQNIFSLAKAVCQRNIGVMAIVHDLNMAAQFADHLYFLRDGKMVASGESEKVFTKSIIEETFCCRVNVYRDPCNNCPYIIPAIETPVQLN